MCSGCKLESLRSNKKGDTQKQDFAIPDQEPHATPTGTGSESVRSLRAPHGERLRFTRGQRIRCTGLTTTQSSPTGQPVRRGRQAMMACWRGSRPVRRLVDTSARVLRDGGATGPCATERSRSSGSSRVGRHVRAGFVRVGGGGFLRDGNGAGQPATGPITRHRPPCPRARRAM
jgi:hypothetical protein